MINNNIEKDHKRLIPSTGKSCSKCGRGGLEFMHEGFLCDYCNYNINNRTTHSDNKSFNYFELIQSISGLLFLAFMIYWIYLIVVSPGGYDVDDCSDGYHIEGYTTYYGETVTDCVRD